ncbi:MAG: ankyrin repeat domain-containing protein [Gammaproteobacteria bacterium]|nr:ankyrin repeat domain-containing protein [Gammaproteobacteria bacterium]
MSKFWIILFIILSFSNTILAESIMKAAKNGNLETVKELIEKGTSPNELDPDDWRETPPLLAAIKNKHSEVAKYLIERGADSKVVDASGKNALTHAAQVGATDLIEILVKNGADIEIIPGDGTKRTPLVWAVLKEQEATAIELIKNGAKTDVEWVHPTKNTTHKLIDTVKEKGLNNLLKHF